MFLFLLKGCNFQDFCVVPKSTYWGTRNVNLQNKSMIFRAMSHWDEGYLNRGTKYDLENCFWNSGLN